MNSGIFCRIPTAQHSILPFTNTAATVRGQAAGVKIYEIRSEFLFALFSRRCDSTYSSPGDKSTHTVVELQLLATSDIINNGTSSEPANVVDHVDHDRTRFRVRSMLAALRRHRLPFGNIGLQRTTGRNSACREAGPQGLGSEFVGEIVRKFVRVESDRTEWPQISGWHPVRCLV